MAILKSLIVKGVSRFLTDTYMSTIRSGIWNGSTIQVGYGGTGVTSAVGDLYTPVFLSSNGIAPCSTTIPHNTKDFVVNGTAYSIFTTYTGTVLPIFAPNALAGTGGYILATNSGKTGLEWVAANAHTHALYVLYDPGTTEQTIRNSIPSMSKGVINLWRNSGNHYTFLGFSNGITETYLGGIGFLSSSDHQPYLKHLNGSYYMIANASNISNNNITVPSNTETTIATIAGVPIKINVLVSNNISTTAVLSSSNSGTTHINAVTASPYYNLIEGSLVTRSIRFMAGDGMTISAATNGTVTFTTSGVPVAQNDSLNNLYPIVWSSENNANDVTGNLLKKTYNYLYWNPAAKAFGHGSGVVASGGFSHAEGVNTTASYQFAHAEGSSTVASGDTSHAEGYLSTASGALSHAEGFNATASGYASHAEGINTEASNQYAHAEGSATTASGDTAHAEGYNTTAYATLSHTEGVSTRTEGYASHAEGNACTTTGDYSHAEGQETAASGWYSHSEGFQTTASGKQSHAEGRGTTSSGEGSHALGYNTTASGSYSFTAGYNTQATKEYEAAFGKYNNSGQNTLFSVGNGDSSSRLNAFEVTSVSNFAIAGGFVKHNSSDSYVLLGGGGHKSLSDIVSESDARYVRLDAGTSEQTIKNSIASLTNGSIEIWRAIASGEAMIGFANGTTKTKLGMLGFSAANTPIFKNTSGTNYLIAHTGNISNANPIATIGTSNTTIATIAGVEIKAKIASYSLSNHTHPLSIAVNSGTNQLTLAASTKYKLTAGGSTYIFTTPPNTWRGIYTGGTSRIGTGTDTKAMNFTTSGNLSVSYLAAGTNSGQSGSTDYFTINISAAANAVGVAGYVAAPTKADNPYSVWMTNANGAPAWRTVTTPSTVPTIGTSDTILATIGGVSVKAKIGSYASSSHTHYYLVTSGDNKDVVTAHTDYSNKLVFVGLKTNNTLGINSSAGTYSFLVGLSGWSDTTAGGAHELAFSQSSGIFRRKATNSTDWGSWILMADSSNTLASVSNNTLTLNLCGDTTTYTPSLSGLLSANIILVSSGNVTTKSSSWTDVADVNTYDGGTYLILISSTTNKMFASGVFSLCKDTDATNDEIPLHVSSTSNGWRPYAKINGNKLLMSSTDISNTTRSYTIKIIKMI